MDVCSIVVSREVTKDRLAEADACMTFSTEGGRLGRILSS
jgi:hypothetical protein